MMKNNFSRIGAKLRALSLVVALATPTFLGAAAFYFFAPPPQHARAQFADQGTWGGTAGGTANAVVITLANVASLNDIIGVPIRFNPAANNTTAVTVAITNALGTTTPTALDRPSSIGLISLSLNELWAGETTSVTYNGSVFVLSSNVDMTPIGHKIDVRGSTAPRGYLIEDGSCYSQTQFSGLNTVIGTTYNAAAPVACSGGQLAVPYANGRLFAALDTQGVNTANILTNAGSGCAATSVAFRCGAQSNTLITANLPPYTPSLLSNNSITQSGSSGSGFSSGGAFPVLSASTITFNPQGGTSTPFTNVPPLLGGITAIKY